MKKQTILFICTHNSARSQMAEGLMRHFHSDRFEAFSAGTEATLVRPEAIKVLAELGIDISSHSSKTLERFLKIELDYVVTVCDSANEACPFFPGGKKRIHKSFRDPSNTKGKEEEVLQAFRDVRDEIRLWLDESFG